MRIYVICILCIICIYYIYSVATALIIFILWLRESQFYCATQEKKNRACIELLFSCLWNEIKGQVLCDKVTASLLIFGDLTSVFASWEPSAQYNLSGKQVRASAAASPMSERGLTKAALFFFHPMIIFLTERKATRISKYLLLRWDELAFKLLRIFVEYIR